VGNYNSFLVRIWNGEDENILRGYIQHVGSREIIYFANWDKMVSFIMSHLTNQSSPQCDVEEAPLLNDSDRVDLD